MCIYLDICLIIAVYCVWFSHNICQELLSIFVLLLFYPHLLKKKCRDHMQFRHLTQGDALFRKCRYDSMKHKTITINIVSFLEIYIMFSH